MKYGIAQWCFPNGQYAFALAEKAGYDGVQVETGLDSNGYYMRDKGMQRIYLEAAKRHRQEIISVVDNDLMYVGCQGKKDEEEYKPSILPSNWDARGSCCRCFSAVKSIWINQKPLSAQ